MKKVLFMLFVMTILLCGLSYCADVVTPTTPIVSEPVKTSWFANTQIWEIVLTIFLAILGLVKAWVASKNATWGKVVDLAEEVVVELNDTVVKDMKAKAPDGKLTQEQIKQLQGTAWAKMIEVGKTRGLDMAKEVGSTYAPVLIAKVAEMFKGNVSRSDI